MTEWGTFGRINGSGYATDTIFRINAELEYEVASQLMDEKVIEKCWSRVRSLDNTSSEYWLLSVRVAEAALICAGNYADNCEYEAAGDLLVNPREILAHSCTDGRSMVKNRHGRLSDQFGLERVDHRHKLKRLSTGVRLQITKPPLLPHMTQVLGKSKRISPEYIQRLEHGQRRIADTMTFLAAWRIFDSAELWWRLQAASSQERRLVEAHLCRFGTRIFHQIGMSLQRSLGEPDYRGLFLIESRWRDHDPKSVLSERTTSVGLYPA
jgi:hypothetical protein